MSETLPDTTPEAESRLVLDLLPAEVETDIRLPLHTSVIVDADQAEDVVFGDYSRLRRADSHGGAEPVAGGTPASETLWSSGRPGPSPTGANPNASDGASGPIGPAGPDAIAIPVAAQEGLASFPEHGHPQATGSIQSRFSVPDPVRPSHAAAPATDIAEPEPETLNAAPSEPPPPVAEDPEIDEPGRTPPAGDPPRDGSPTPEEPPQDGPSAPADPPTEPPVDPPVDPPVEPPAEPPVEPSLPQPSAPVADAPKLSVDPAFGSEDTAIPLTIAAQLTDPAEILSIVISGIPAGAFLSAGTDNGDGTWTLTPDELAGLAITPPANSDADLSLTVTAVSTDGGSAASTSAALSVTVNPVSDDPVLVLAPASGSEDTAIPLSIDAALTDASEVLSITISGVPSGATLSAGTSNGDGTWSLTPGELSGLTITPPADSDTDFTLTVQAISQDGTADAAIVSGTLTVTVTAVVDGPALSVSDVVATVPRSVIVGTASDQVLTGTGMADEIRGRDGDDTIHGGGGGGSATGALNISATLTDTDGSEVLLVIVSGVPGNATLSAGTNNGDGTWTLEPGDLTGLTLTAPPGSVSFPLSITAIAREISTGVASVRSKNIVVAVDEGGDVLDGEGGNDSILAGGSPDTLLGGSGSDTLEGGAGADVLDGGSGSDWASYASSGSGVTVDLAAGTGQGGDAQGDVLVGIEHVAGSSHGDRLTGDAGANALSGNAGEDTLRGGDGDDTLEGGAGADVLEGGSGSDWASYASSGSGVTVELAAGTGQGGDAQGDVLVGIENLVGSGQADRLTGDAGANVLSGGNGNDTLEGGAGADTLEGGAGTDTASYASSGAGVTVNLGTGLGAGGDAAGDVLSTIENLIGSAHADALTGSSAANRLTGGLGDDTLDGGAGADTLEGGAGDDLYVVDSTGDVVVEAAGEGHDEVRTALGSYTLAAHVEDLTYAGSGGFAGTGNGEANRIVGGSGADTLRGLAGDDRLEGGGGNDVLEGGTGADTLEGGSGSDTASYASSAVGVTANLATGLGAGGDAEGDVLSGIENLTGSSHADRLTGDGGANLLTGGAGDDTLDGGGGNDTLNGGAGNDVYVLGASSATIVEAEGGGIDEVRTAAASYTLGNELENLAFVGSGSFQGTGNALANIIVGGAGNDSLSGAAGDDSLLGGAGNDTLVGGAGADRLEGGLGTDTASYAASKVGVTVDLAVGLGAGGDAQGDVLTGIEVLIGSSHADRLIGDSSNNMLVGGSGNDTLEGGRGDDTAFGGAGNDVFLFAPGDGHDYFSGGSLGTDEIALDVESGPGTGSWTLALSSGTVNSSSTHELVFSADAAGAITLVDGSTLTFDGIERIRW